MSCSQEGKLLSSSRNGTLLTKNYFKRGITSEKIYDKAKLVGVREFMDGRLVLRYPIYPQTLESSTIRLRNGGPFFQKGSIDTLEILNPNIPEMNFGIRVSNGNISRLSHGIYLLKEVSSAKHVIDTMKVWVTVFQPENKKLGLGNFDSDSVTFIIR